MNSIEGLELSARKGGLRLMWKEYSEDEAPSQQSAAS